MISFNSVMQHTVLYDRALIDGRVLLLLCVCVCVVCVCVCVCACVCVWV